MPSAAVAGGFRSPWPGCSLGGVSWSLCLLWLRLCGRLRPVVRWSGSRWCLLLRRRLGLRWSLFLAVRCRPGRLRRGRRGGWVCRCRCGGRRLLALGRFPGRWRAGWRPLLRVRRRSLCRFLPGVRPGRWWRWCVVRWGLCLLLLPCLLLWLLLLLCVVAVGGGLLPRAAVVFGGALSFGGGALWAPLFLCPTPSILLLPTATTHHNTLRYRNTTKRKTRGNTRKHGEAQGNTKKHRETQQPITNRLFTPTLPLPCINYLAPAQTSLMQRRLRPLSLEKALPMQPRTTRARGLIAVVRFPFLDHPGSCHQAYFSYNSYCYSKNNAICRSSRGASRRRRTGQAAAGGAPWQTFATNATR